MSKFSRSLGVKQRSLWARKRVFYGVASHSTLFHIVCYLVVFGMHCLLVVLLLVFFLCKVHEFTSVMITHKDEFLTGFPKLEWGIFQTSFHGLSELFVNR